MASPNKPVHDASREPPPRRAPDPENIVGYAIAGRYLIRRCVSQGGMGVVYLARQAPLDRDVIVKVVRSDMADTEAEARFRREARSLSLLSHPNVVQIHDYGFDEPTSLYFIVMEYIPGITLSQFRKQRHGALPVEEVLPIAVQMLEGVAEAHRAGLIHRDLKPSNVMLTSSDGVRLGIKLLDFGLSKFAEGDEPVTRANTIAGSAMYMAPEFIHANGAPDARADVYSLGVVLYQLLSDENPVQGEDPYQLLHQQVTGAVRPLAEALGARRAAVPEAMVRLIDRCLALSPGERPADGQALLDAVKESLASVVPNPAQAALAAASAQELASTPEPVTLRGGTGAMSVWTDSGLGAPPRPSPSPLGSLRVLGALAAATATLVIVALVPLAVLLVVFLGDGWREPAPVPPPPPSSEVASSVLRAGALRALRDGEYERAVALTTEAVSVAPGDGDLMELLTLVTSLRDRQGNERRAEAAVGVPEPGLGPSTPAPHRAEDADAIGTAVILSEPNDVAFEIPGILRGQTPAQADLPVGVHQILFFVDGKVVHTDRIEIQADGVALVDVDVDVDAVDVQPIDAVPTDTVPGLPRPGARPDAVYVFVPSGVKPRVIEQALQVGLPGSTVSAFGSYHEFTRALDDAPPGAVVAPRSVLDALGLPAHLQGRDRQGGTTERYVLLAPQPVDPTSLGNAVIGVVDLTGRESSGELVGALLGTATPPRVKRVAEESDLLPMLQFGGADAIMLTERAAGRLLSATQMALTVTNVAAGAGLPAVSVLEGAERERMLAAVQALGSDANARIGVDSWGR